MCLPCASTSASIRWNEYHVLNALLPLYTNNISFCFFFVPEKKDAVRQKCKNKHTVLMQLCYNIKLNFTTRRQSVRQEYKNLGCLTEIFLFQEFGKLEKYYLRLAANKNDQKLLCFGFKKVLMLKFFYLLEQFS